jgi:broad specificity phosphatase PhoE
MSRKLQKKSMARFALVSLLALGSTQLRPSSAGAVPAFVARHLPAGMHRRSAATPRCAAEAKPWAGREVPENCIRVFLVRHGAVDLTTPGMTFPKNCFYGGHNVPLSAYGEAEARAAAEMLADEKLEMVFSSPLSRAFYGAERVAERHGLKVVQDERFKEVARGRWLGKTKDQINKEFPTDLKSFANDPTWKGHGGETYRELSTRVLDGLDSMLVAARSANATRIALVSHMWVTKSIVTDALSIHPDQQDKWEETQIPTASISVLDFPRAGRGGKAIDVLSVGVKPPILAQDAVDPATGKPWGG